MFLLSAKLDSYHMLISDHLNKIYYEKKNCEKKAVIPLLPP